jgi:hypothetical protein
MILPLLYHYYHHRYRHRQAVTVLRRRNVHRQWQHCHYHHHHHPRLPPLHHQSIEPKPNVSSSPNSILFSINLDLIDDVISTIIGGSGPCLDYSVPNSGEVLSLEWDTKNENMVGLYPIPHSHVHHSACKIMRFDRFNSYYLAPTIQRLKYGMSKQLGFCARWKHPRYTCSLLVDAKKRLIIVCMKLDFMKRSFHVYSIWHFHLLTVYLYQHLQLDYMIILKLLKGYSNLTSYIYQRNDSDNTFVLV